MHVHTHALMQPCTHTQTHTHTAHSYQCVQYFSVSDQWCGYQHLGFSVCTHTLILAAVHRDAGCVNTVRESAWKLTLKQIVDLSPCSVYPSHFSSSPYSKTVVVFRKSAHFPNSHRINGMICSAFNTGLGIFVLFFGVAVLEKVPFIVIINGFCMYCWFYCTCFLRWLLLTVYIKVSLPLNLQFLTAGWIFMTGLDRDGQQLCIYILFVPIVVHNYLFFLQPKDQGMPAGLIGWLAQALVL